jgi:hypothetical protein
MRSILIPASLAILACAPHQDTIRAHDSTAQRATQIVAASSTPRAQDSAAQTATESVAASSTQRDAGHVIDLPLYTAADIAVWRNGPAVPDKLDTLIASALSANGSYDGNDEEYYFSGAEDAVVELRKIPDAIPRLVECLGWDKRAAATYNQTTLLVGVVCYQAILGSAYNNKLNDHDAFPKAGLINYTNPSLEEVRRAQAVWRKVLVSNPQ